MLNLENKKKWVLILSLAILSGFFVKNIEGMQLDVFNAKDTEETLKNNYEYVVNDVIGKNDFSKMKEFSPGIFTFANQKNEDKKYEGEFKIVETKEEYISEKGYYLVKILFSKPIRHENLSLENIHLNFLEKPREVPPTPASTAETPATVSAPAPEPTSTASDSITVPMVPTDSTIPVIMPVPDSSAPATEVPAADSSATPLESPAETPATLPTDGTVPTTPLEVPVAPSSTDGTAPSPTTEAPVSTPAESTPAPEPAPAPAPAESTTPTSYFSKTLLASSFMYLAKSDAAIVPQEQTPAPVTTTVPVENKIEESVPPASTTNTETKLEKTSDPAVTDPKKPAAPVDETTLVEPKTKPETTSSDKKTTDAKDPAPTEPEKPIKPVDETTSVEPKTKSETPSSDKKTTDAKDPAVTEPAKPIKPVEETTSVDPKTDSAKPAAPTNETTSTTSTAPTDAATTVSDTLTVPMVPTDSATPVTAPTAVDALPLSAKIRGPQLVIVDNNELIIAFVLDTAEAELLNELELGTISSLDDEKIENQKISMTQYFIGKKEDKKVELTKEDEGKEKEKKEKLDEYRKPSTEDHFDRDKKDFLEYFFKKYSLRDRYEKEFESVNKKVYYFDENLLAESKSNKSPQKDKSKNDNFEIISGIATFLPEKNIYFMDLLFSKEIDYKKITTNSFVLDHDLSLNAKPSIILVTKKEIIFAFTTTKPLDSKLVKITGIKPKNSKETMDGYYVLPAVRDLTAYNDIKSQTKDVYDVEIDPNNQLIFQTSNLAFTPLNSITESSATVAMRLPNNPAINPKCSIMLFGKDLQPSGGADAIPITGLSLIPQSSGYFPIDTALINNMENQKQKQFLTFTYLEDMEIINDKRALYLKLTAPAGLRGSTYQGTLSVDLYCPQP